MWLRWRRGGSGIFQDMNVRNGSAESGQLWSSQWQRSSDNDLGSFLLLLGRNCYACMLMNGSSTRGPILASQGQTATEVWFQRDYITLANLKMTTSEFGNSLCHRKHTWPSKKQLLLESMEKWSWGGKCEPLCLLPAQLPSPMEKWPALWNTRSEEFAHRSLSALRHGNVELATSLGRELKFRQASGLIVTWLLFMMRSFLSVRMNFFLSETVDSVTDSQVKITASNLPSISETKHKNFVLQKTEW